MIASLAWYPAARPAWERLWADVRARLGLGPEHLSWPEDFAPHWEQPDLLLSMTCALPMRLGLADRLHVVGSPVWDLPDLPAGHYTSNIVTRADDTRPLTECAAEGIAVNDRHSQSGFGVLAVEGLGGPIRETGSHAASMNAVAAGETSLTAIDTVTWVLAPHPALTVRKRTTPTPACPFVTALPEMVAPLRAALDGAIDAQSPKDRAATRLIGRVDLPEGVYATCPDDPIAIARDMRRKQAV